jgi:hypothetical protein
MTLRIWSLLALLAAALSLGPSFAHLLEAPPRLLVWSPELWREATVFNGQFRLFGILGGPLDGGAVLITAGLAWLMRGRRAAFWWALAAALLFGLGLLVWLAWVAPVNAVLATWQPGPIPEEFGRLRTRWETGHMVMAGIKLIGFTAVALSIILSCPTDRKAGQGQRASVN